MRLFSYKVVSSLLVAIGCLTSVVNANLHELFEDEFNENDVRALKEFLDSKRDQDIKENPLNLTISGDIRANWKNANEKQFGKHLRGGNAKVFKIAIDDKPLDSKEQDAPAIAQITKERIRVSKNDMDVAANLRFDVVYKRTWGVAQVKFGNSAGIDDNGYDFNEDPEGYHGSGTSHKVNLKKAYFGYDLYTNCGNRGYIEVGRRGKLDDVLESDIQFDSRLDGLVLTYSGHLESMVDWYAKAVGVVVDTRSNHYVWATEFGFLNIKDIGLDVKYSFIDWPKIGRNCFFVHNPKGFKFRNSQLFLAYHLNPDLIKAPVEFYGAALWNHAARKRHFSFEKNKIKVETEKKLRKGLGWYAGVQIGRVEKEGDWAFEVEYQLVQADAIPDNDNGGIGRGNVLEESMTYTGRGNGNYKGWKFDLLYAITDELTLDTNFKFSKAEDKEIGGSHDFSQLELEAIYAF